MERSVYVVIGWTPGSGDATYCNVFVIFIFLTVLFACRLLKTVFCLNLFLACYNN